MKQIFLFLSALLLAACSKTVIDDTNTDNDLSTLIIHIHANSTRANLSDIFSRINIALFNEDGERVKTVSQTSSDGSFGLTQVSAQPGNYTLVIMAHSCNGSATITAPDKVTFPSNKVTDTFYAYTAVTLTDIRQDIDISLQRCVSMIRLYLSGLPAGTETLKCYYVGGSSTFSPQAGFGCVNSKQTELRAFVSDGIYEIYTFPHSTEDIITKLEMTALDANDNILGESSLTNIPVTINRVTEYTGDFSATDMSSVTIGITVNPEWEGYDSFTF